MRFSAGVVAERVAARLSDGTDPVPRSAAEELVAAIPESDVERFVELAGRVAPERWFEPVEHAGAELAREPLLAGPTSALDQCQLQER